MKKNPMRSTGAEPQLTPIETGMDALAWAQSANTSEDIVQQLQVRSRQRRFRRLTATLSGVAMILITAAAWTWQDKSKFEFSSAAATAFVSLPAKEELPDGSVVELKRDASISVEFEPEVRRVVLRGGEAHFQVKKNVRRPFIVVADGIEVRAVGTAFTVEVSQEKVEVLVTEGIVAVDKREASALSLAASEVVSSSLIDAGKRVVVATGGTMSQQSPLVLTLNETELRARLAWRIPRLEFSGTPLSQAIAMFNRHGATRLTLDPVLGDLQMSGMLRADDVDSLLLLLQNEFGIQADRRASGEIFLRRM